MFLVFLLCSLFGAVTNGYSDMFFHTTIANRYARTSRKKTQKLNYKLSQPVERFTVFIFSMLLIVPPPMPRGTANEKQDKKTVELIEIFIHSLIQSIAKLIKHETIRISVRLDID